MKYEMGEIERRESFCGVREEFVMRVGQILFGIKMGNKESLR